MSEELAQALLIGYVTYQSAEAIASAFSFTKNPSWIASDSSSFFFYQPSLFCSIGAKAPKRKRRQGARTPKNFRSPSRTPLPNPNLTRLFYLKFSKIFLIFLFCSLGFSILVYNILLSSNIGYFPIYPFQE